MTTVAVETKREQAAHRALARSALYQYLSQSLAYPSEDVIATLRDSDAPQVAEEAAYLASRPATLFAELAGQLRDTDAATIQSEHRRIFSHILSADCPPTEMAYTTDNIYQETQDMTDLTAFFRAFGLELAEKERIDHISVELEFMHALTFKEAYAQVHHGPEKARLCRVAQRKFLQDHLARWAPMFAKLLKEKAGGGYFAGVASLTEAFISEEVAMLRAKPEVVTGPPGPHRLSPGDDGCPAADDCPIAESMQHDN